MHHIFIPVVMLEGAIPSSTSRLINLKTLILSGNHLSGELSSQFIGLSQLRTLYLERNLFHGKYGTPQH